MEQILIENIARVSNLAKSPYNEQINDLLEISKILNDHVISDVTEIPCKRCNDKIKLRFMRLHIAKHFVNKEIKQNFFKLSLK